MINTHTNSLTKETLVTSVVGQCHPMPYSALLIMRLVYMYTCKTFITTLEYPSAGIALYEGLALKGMHGYNIVYSYVVC